MGVNVKARLEPVERGLVGIDVLSEVRFGVTSPVDGLGPQNVGRREVVGIEGDEEVGGVERSIKLNQIQSRSVDGFIAECHVHFGGFIDDMVKLELNNALIGKVAKVERECSKHAVHHQPGIEVVAQDGPVGHHELPTLFNGEGRAGLHGDVRIDG